MISFIINKKGFPSSQNFKIKKKISLIRMLRIEWEQRRRKKCVAHHWTLRKIRTKNSLAVCTRMYVLTIVNSHLENRKKIRERIKKYAIFYALKWFSSWNFNAARMAHEADPNYYFFKISNFLLFRVYRKYEKHKNIIIFLYVNQKRTLTCAALNIT
jgi:hypothetical protein